jgi:TM2 domain-containing membrane protein YozV
MLDPDQVRAEEEQLRLAIRELPDGQRADFYRAFNQQLKDPDTYAVLNYLLIAGLHHFYLGKWLRGAINLFFFCAALALMLANLFWLGLAVVAVIVISELYALFRAQLIVQDYNNALMRTILKEVNKPAGQVAVNRER